ncbi:FxSxx-COOH system tetratricopeptide repeat protein, partial [Frankia sp. Ag45/Mut15]
MEIGVFAEVFASPAAARTVLEAAGLSRADHPAWETARLFWSEVSHLLKAGALTDGRAALFAAAGALFPANPVFTAAAPARPGAGPGVVLPVWRVPWPRNPNFVGRGEELAGLQGRLAAGAVSVLPQALQGLGGVGKTQLAVEYAHRSRGDYDLVWWLNAEQPADLVAGLADLAGRLGVAVAGAAAESVERVVSVLAAGRVVRRWLLLVDNAGVPSDLQGLLAAAGVDGHVLVTSRDPGWAGRAQTVAVDVLSRADAVRLLQSRALRLTGAEADRVADLLGDLPLAVEQAGTWLASTPMTAQDYCTLVAKRAREILAQGTPAAYPVPVAATWTAAVDRLDDPAARWLLWLWACCGPEPIPADLISAPSVELLPAPLDAAAGDPLRTGQLVSSVVSLGLVRITADGIVMHRLVQTILRDHTPPPDRDTARDTVHRLLAAAAPETSELPESWQRYAALRPHIVASEMMDSDREDCRATVIRLINYLNDSGDYPTGLALTQEIHSRWHHRLGEDHPDTLTAAESLAGAMWSMGDYPAARGLVEGVLARRREILGEDHPDTLRTAGNLASTLRSMG